VNSKSRHIAFFFLAIFAGMQMLYLVHSASHFHHISGTENKTFENPADYSVVANFKKSEHHHTCMICCHHAQHFSIWNVPQMVSSIFITISFYKSFLDFSSLWLSDSLFGSTSLRGPPLLIF